MPRTLRFELERRILERRAEGLWVLKLDTNNHIRSIFCRAARFGLPDVCIGLRCGEDQVWVPGPRDHVEGSLHDP